MPRIRKAGRRSTLAATAVVTVVAGGATAWAVPTRDGTAHGGVSASSATPARRAEYSEPADMPVVHACEGVGSLFDPDCW